MERDQLLAKQMKDEEINKEIDSNIFWASSYVTTRRDDLYDIAANNLKWMASNGYAKEIYRKLEKEIRVIELGKTVSADDQSFCASVDRRMYDVIRGNRCVRDRDRNTDYEKELYRQLSEAFSDVLSSRVAKRVKIRDQAARCLLLLAENIKRQNESQFEKPVRRLNHTPTTRVAASDQQLG